MQVLDLFSGIGGFSLGLEMADRRFDTMAFCEKDAYARRVLRKNWPDVPIFEDVRELTGDEFSGIDVLCGGVPCQPYSFAGKQGGDGDDRDLLPEMLRLIENVRPRWAIVENVRGFVSMPMGLDRCISEMEDRGYSVQAFLAGAVGVDAPHRRERCWVVGHRIGEGLEGFAGDESGEGEPGRDDEGQDRPAGAASLCRGTSSDAGALRQSGFGFEEHAGIEGASGDEPDGLCSGGRRDGTTSADTDQGDGRRGPNKSKRVQAGGTFAGRVRETATDADGFRCRRGASATGWEARHQSHGSRGDGIEAVADAEEFDQRPGLRPDESEGIGRGRSGDGSGEVQDLADADRAGEKQCGDDRRMGRGGKSVEDTGNDDLGWWLPEPPVGRVAHGIPNRVDRLRCLGNAVVAQVVANIGRAIIEAERKD